MAASNRQANKELIDETRAIQDKTKESVFRMQQQAAETENLAVETIEELRRQHQQTQEINAEVENVSSKLDQSAALQNRFDRWAGNWWGGKKRSAMKEASAEIKLRNEQEHTKVREVFQQEKFDKFTRNWKKSSMVLCSDPTVPIEDIFDPSIQENLQNSHWVIDFSLACIDAEGWTYSYDFNTLNRVGSGDTQMKWNSYVRRRKWRYNDKMGGETIDKIRERNTERAATLKSNTSSKHAEKIGYVPRHKQAAGLKASGLTATGLRSKNQTDANKGLDAETAADMRDIRNADAEIDEGIDAISRTIDNLGSLAGTIRDEAVSQQASLEQMEKNMDNAQTKQTVINARQRYLLK